MRVLSPDRGWICLLGAVWVLVLSAGMAGSAAAQQQPISDQAAFRDMVNANTVTILGGSMTGTYLRLADDIARTVGDKHNLRILPIRGGGAPDNIRDILYLRGIDMGMITADSVETFRGKRFFESISDRMAYITKLYNAEFHVLVGPDVQSLSDLDGKIVAYHGSGSKISGQLLFRRLNVKPAKWVKMLMFEGAQKIKEGKVAAVVRSTGKPVRGIDRVLKINPEIRLLPLQYDDSLVETSYLPTQFTHQDYPSLVPKGETIQTIAVGVALAVYNWKPGTDRYRRLEKFVNAFFSKFDKVVSRKGRHPKWDEVNIAAKLPGWKRFGPAQRWLEENRMTVSSVRSGSSLERQFKAFLEQRRSAGRFVPGNTDAEGLFAEFVRWRDRDRRRQ